MRNANIKIEFSYSKALNEQNDFCKHLNSNFNKNIYLKFLIKYISFIKN